MPTDLPLDVARPVVRGLSSSHLVQADDGLLTSALATLATEGPALEDVLVAATLVVLRAHTRTDAVALAVGDPTDPGIVTGDLCSARLLSDLLADVRHRRRGQLPLPAPSVLLVVGDDAVPVELSLTGTTVVESEPGFHSGQWDLVVEVQRGPVRPRVSVAFDDDLFGPAYIRRLLDHLGRAVEAVIIGRGTVGEVRLVGPDERAVLNEWARGPVVPVDSRRLERLVAEQAERTPDAVAVTARGVKLTYRELVGRARQLAGLLRERGVQPGDLVVVLLPRDVDVLVAILGVLGAGAAYVPLEPSDPVKRLRSVAEDCGARAVVTHASLASAVAGPACNVLVCLDRDGVALASQAEERWPALTEGGDIAYVMYTSGSTGRPKGVAVPHTALMNYLQWARAAIGGRGGGTALCAPIAFDLSVTPLFLPLLEGQTVTILPEGLGIAPVSTALRRGDGFAYLILTPTHLELLAQWRPPPFPAEAAGYLVVGGEALTADAVRPWVEHPTSPVAVLNAYGPTEATNISCVWEVSVGVPLDDGPVPIGRPIWNATLYVLDEGGQQVPIGVPGELYIGGVGVASGYVRRPELTAERFVPDPFGGSGGLLFRTGDLVRYRDDGALVYLGRIDDQIKVLGHRVEPGEVEVVAAAHPSVRRVAVAVRRAVSGQVELVAYVVPGPLGFDASELAAYLRARLPAAMVPADYAVVPSLPVTANGKVDRSRLAAMSSASLQAAVSDPVRTAVSDLESALVRAFEWASGRPVGVDEDVPTSVGADAIVAAALLRLRAEGGPELTLATLYERRTIRRLAATPAPSDSP